MQPRVGIFGGTFDPPHLGHLILAAEAHAQLHLSQLLWVLTAAPPHKEGKSVTALDQRLQMVRLAIGGNPAFELSTVDIDRPGPHFTADTLALVRKQYPDAKLALIIGGDSLRDLPTWHDPTRVVAGTDEIGVMRRPGDAVDLASLEGQVPGLTDRLRWIEAPLLEISSHEIRERRSGGRPIRYFIPQLVYDFIIQNDLYAGP